MGKKDETILRTVVIAVLMDMVTFTEVLMGGFFVIADVSATRLSFLLHILKVYLQFLDLKKRFNWLHNSHEKL